MNRAGWWALAALVVMGGLTPLAVQAQTGANGTKAHSLTGAPLIYYGADSTRYTVGSGQGLPTTETTPNRTTWTYWQNVIANNAMTPGLIDSALTPIYVQPYRRLALYVYGNVDSLTTDARVAIQCRCHFTQSNDSLQTFPIPWRTTQSDSAGDIFTAGTGTTIDHTEKYWTLKSKQLLPHGDIIPVPIPNVEFPCPYLSVRVRLLTLTGAGASRLKVRVNLVGAAQ